jgi:PAS domain S-box-containing protein
MARRVDCDSTRQLQGHKLSVLTVYVGVNERGPHAVRGRHDHRGSTVSEASERALLDGAVVDGVLGAVERPALVCDSEGVVRAWNDALVDLRGSGELAETHVEALVDWAGSDPLEEAVATDERTTGNAQFVDDERFVGSDQSANDERLGENTRSANDRQRYTATVRPLTRDDAVGAAGAVVVFEGAGEDSADHREVEDGADDGTVDDGADRGTVEEAHRESHERLQTVVETLPVAMLVVDADGRIDFVHGLDFAALDCDRADLVGADVEVLAGEYGAVVAGCRRALAGEQTTETVTVGGQAYEGTIEPVRIDGEVTGAIAAAVDVTDREERERELAATNERLDLALDHTDAGVWEWHVGENRVYWHEITSRLLGIDHAPYRTREEFGDLVHPEDRERVFAAATEAVETDGQLRVEFRLADDPDRWLFTEAELQRVDDGADRLVGTVRDVTERKARERELVEREQRLRAVVESSPDPIAMKDREGRYRVVNEAMLEAAGWQRSALRGKTAHEVFDDGIADRLERHRRAVLESESARVSEEWFPSEDGDRRVRLTTAPLLDSDGAVEGTVAIVRDITEVERQHAELERLTAIQGLVHESVRALTDATTRPEIEETVCERLADSEFYQAAWVGSRDHSSGEVTPDHVAGGEDIREYLEAVTITVDTSESGQGPGGTAYRSGEVQVIEDVRADPAFEPWREAALDQGFESVAVVPLTHGSTTHGILAVYTDRTDAFGEREVAGFATLGEAVGFALSATQHRRLLESDSVLEIEFEVTGGGPFMDATAEHDCRFVLENAVLGRDGRVIDYLTVEGADPELGAETARDFDILESIRPIDGADGPHFEMHWRDSVFQYLTEAGAQGMRGVIEDGTGTMFVEAPGDIDVRQLIDAMLIRFDEVELVAKREREPREVPWWRTHGDIGTTLTDRQRSILQAAYYSGYYEWPRETDAETLADSMGVASTTLLQHLRKGHGRVLEALFDS